jgi:hypothetical protein
MSNKLTKIGASLAAVAALAVGGSAIAGAAQKSAPPKPAASQNQEPLAPDTDNVQQGDQTASDQESASEQAGEASSETAGESASESDASDGPGGYADAKTRTPTPSSRASTSPARLLPNSPIPRDPGRRPGSRSLQGERGHQLAL